MLIAPRKWPKVPWVLVMMVLGGLLGAFAPLADWGVALLAAVPRGLPKVVLPDLSALPFTQALVATLPVAAVILAETLLASSARRRKTATASTAAARSATYAVGNVAAGSSAAASCRAACRARPSTSATAAGRSSCPSWRA